MLKNIKEKFKGAHATVIWSGNGYHVYLPIRAFILESEGIFAEFKDPSKKFLRFSEKMLANNKADPCHSNSLSFKNCMLRVPGSHNWECVNRNNNSSGPLTEVKIVQKWNGIKNSSHGIDSRDPTLNNSRNTFYNNQLINSHSVISRVKPTWTNR